MCPRPGRIASDNRLKESLEVARRVGLRAGQRLVEDDTEGILIARRAGSPVVLDQLGGEIHGGSEHHPCVLADRVRRLGVLFGRGDAEIEHDRMDVAVLDGEKDVRWLEIAMRDAAAMSSRHGVTHRNQDRHRLGDGNRARPLQPAGEIFTFEQLHDEIDPLELLARVDDLHDVRVSKAGGEPRFFQESSASDRVRGKRAVQHLDRDALAIAGAQALVDDAHRSDAQAAPDLVFADPRSKQKRGPCSVFGRFQVTASRKAALLLDRHHLSFVVTAAPV